MNTPETTLTVFQPFSKIARLSRGCVITEKLDGTNAQIAIVPASDAQKAGHLVAPFVAVAGGFAFLAGSRNRWLGTGTGKSDDNFGFAKWVADNAEALAALGEGRHFGEWWGLSIQRGYGLKEKRFSMFNVTRWCLRDSVPAVIPNANPTAPVKLQEVLPDCVGLVPVLYRGPFGTPQISDTLYLLKGYGSRAVPGFDDPEGIVIRHDASGTLFKKTINNDESPKSAPL